MKITVEFEHSHELINLLKSLGSNLKEDEPVTGCREIESAQTGYCSFAGTEHDKCDNFICMEDCT